MRLTIIHPCIGRRIGALPGIGIGCDEPRSRTLTMAETETQAAAARTISNRLVSLDAFRGATMALMNVQAVTADHRGGEAWQS